MSALDAHELRMKRALELARQGLGRTHPNPAVGCVITHGGEIVAEGFHAKAGGPHAEVVALRALEATGIDPAECESSKTLRQKVGHDRRLAFFRIRWVGGWMYLKGAQLHNLSVRSILVLGPPPPPSDSPCGGRAASE